VPDTTTTTSNALAASPPEVQTLRQPTGGFVNKSPAQQNKIAESNQSNDKPISGGNTKKELLLVSPKNKLLSASPENKISTGLIAEGANTDLATGERSRKVRSGNNETPNDNNTAATEKKSYLSDYVSRVVTVKSNEYKKVAFGGIRDLQLTVTNDSKYVLDNVIVELQYIKPNELPLKTENIRFTSIEPNSTSTIRVPDTNRGIKVVFRIINVKSRQMDEGVAGN